jgi:hypothetical protein
MVWLENLSTRDGVTAAESLAASASRYAHNTMNPIEDSTTPAEVSPAPQVPPENPSPAVVAAPPAASLATQGEVTDERALEVARREAAIEERERKARETEQQISNRERKAQEREDALRLQSALPVKTKRKRNFTDPILCEPEVED